jgi:hypothetical protein
MRSQHSVFPNNLHQIKFGSNQGIQIPPAASVKTGKDMLDELFGEQPAGNTAHSGG